MGVIMQRGYVVPHATCSAIDHDTACVSWQESVLQGRWSSGLSSVLMRSMQATTCRYETQGDIFSAMTVYGSK